MTQKEHNFQIKMHDGAHIHCRHFAKPGATRLAITHGNGFAVDGYRVFWQPLLADFDVVLFDMRNHGRSERVGADGHNYLQLARDMGAIKRGIDAELGQARTVAICHSMSSRAAMKHAVEMEWVWDGLVLFDPPNVPPRDHALFEQMRVFETKLVDYAMSRQDRFASVEELIASFDEGRGQRHWQAEARRDMAHAVLTPSAQGFELSCQRELEASIYLAALTLNLWPDASLYGGPVVMIGADPEWQGAPPTGRANRALAVEGHYDYEFIAQTGHLLQIEKPDLCRAALYRFLDKNKLR